MSNTTAAYSLSNTAMQDEADIAWMTFTPAGEMVTISSHRAYSDYSTSRTVSRESARTCWRACLADGFVRR